MATVSRSDGTRDSLNQPPPLEGYNLFLENRPLVEALDREGAGWAADRAVAFGALLTGEPVEWGRLANEHPPRLRTHDRFGDRIDEVEFHPAWHELMRTSIEHGLHALRDAAGRSRRPRGAFLLDGAD
jgi:putative acyl-CoA dehydrogenase